MTWLSRLLPQHDFSRIAPTTERSKRARRRIALEHLEDRTLLANALVNYNPLTYDLTITLDTFNDAVAIFEAPAAAGGQVTVSRLSASTTINGLSVGNTTSGPVRNITVVTPGSTNFNNNTNKINLTGQNKSMPTTVQNVRINPAAAAFANLGLAVNNVNNSGELLVNVISARLAGLNPVSPNPVVLNGPATVTNSFFGSININQTGPCPASVTLDGVDTRNGNVRVSLGNFDNDAIIVQNSTHLGSVTLIEGTGNGNTVTVTNNDVRDLTVTQNDSSTTQTNPPPGDRITITDLRISPIGNGVRTTQGSNNADNTTITRVTAPLGVLPPNFPLAALPSIIVVQGNGNNDVAAVNDSKVAGDIRITQGNGNSDNAQINRSIVGFSVGTGFDLQLFGGTMAITQGNGNSDVAIVDASLANNVTLVQGNGNSDVMRVNNSTVNDTLRMTQGNGNSDLMEVLGTDVGTTVLVPNVGVFDINGDAFLTQGNGGGDTINVDQLPVGGNAGNRSSFNNLTINQGGNGPIGTICQAPALDTVNINGTDIASNLFINQGIDSNTTGAFVVNIATTSNVNAGGRTRIIQTGGGNTLIMGGGTIAPLAGAWSFFTYFLDVFMGALGGAYAQAQNTTVAIGPFAQAFTIMAGGAGNTYADLGGNNGITVDTAAFNTI